MIYIKAFVLGM